MPGRGARDHLVEVGVCFHNLWKMSQVSQEDPVCVLISRHETENRVESSMCLPITSLVLTHFLNEKSWMFVSFRLLMFQLGCLLVCGRGVLGRDYILSLQSYKARCILLHFNKIYSKNKKINMHQNWN